jgi:hypothetical protein
MRQSMLYFFFLLSLLSCNSSPTVKAENDDINKIFFPIAGSILAELKEIDSLPVAIIKYTSNGIQSDTVIFSKEKMRYVADELLTPDISLPEYKKFYTETVFLDNTINTITMSYTTISDQPVIRKIEVMINPENEKVKSIYVEKLQNSPDSNVLRKMIWTTGKNLQVISLINRKGQPEQIRTEKYEWGIN